MPTPAEHILVLTDRDWTHPQGGGTGTNLYGLVSRWLAWGHRVTVVSAGYPGAEAVERPAPGLELHHLGGRLTVFARAARAVRGGLAADADVVLEIVNGIAFFTPLWRLRKPRAVLVHHVHRDMYVEELGRRGAIAAWVLETLPLRHLYGNVPFVTGSEAARASLGELGIEPERVTVAYNGVEAATFPARPEAPEPTLLYLGRLKRYKRLELLLDVLEAIPGTRLEIAGDGDHRAALEADVAARGLADSVTLHGHVDEARKRELLASAWLMLTASSAEGWCLAVVEAAAAGTPSAALRVGGLKESIADGRTGALAETPEELIGRVREILGDGGLRAELGAAARERAGSFTWEGTARRTLDVLQGTRERAPARLSESLRRRLTREPAGVAVASLAAGGASLLLAMALARVLGAGGYGALAALVSLLLILSVPAAAVQLAVARATQDGVLGPAAALGAAVRRWQALGLAWAAGLAGAAVLAREPLAALTGVEHPWAAAAVVPTGALWVALALGRGALQGVGENGAVATNVLVEAGSRVALALALVGVGAGVTGAVLAVPLSILLALAALRVTGPAALRGHGGGAGAVPLHALLAGAWLPAAGLTLLAAVGHLDVVVAQHRLSAAEAGAYSAAAVASKVVVWAAAGLALALLPELSRHVRSGAAGAGRLVRTLALVGAVALPPALVCIVAAGPLLRLVFGPALDGAAGALPWLTLAMVALAAAYVAVQHSLALGGRGVLVLLAAVALAEPLLLLGAGSEDPRALAGALAAVQLGLAAAAIGAAAWAATRPARRAAPA